MPFTLLYGALLALSGQGGIVGDELHDVAAGTVCRDLGRACSESFPIVKARAKLCAASGEEANRPGIGLTSGPSLLNRSLGGFDASKVLASSPGSNHILGDWLL
jgi:hypothetical protein